MEENEKTEYRVLLKDRIIEKAITLFLENGIKSITMDHIAGSLCISKRTLYEIFEDKESLIEACVLKRQERAEAYLAKVLKESANVLEVILRCFQNSIQDFHNTNKQLYEDLKKYPRINELKRESHNLNFEDTVKFFQQGVEQGLFRKDVNIPIICRLLSEQFYVLVNTDLCTEYHFVDVYENIMFTLLRGIATEKGAAMLETFLQEYRATERQA